MKKLVRVLLVGSAGRMGQAIVDAATGNPNIEMVGLCDKDDPLEPAISRCDVVIDFSQADAIDDVCQVSALGKKPLVIGTTGHSPEQRRGIESCAQAVPVVLSSNYSVGVNALFWLTRKAAEMLGPEFDLEIVEMHHRMKKDAPSGTAKTLAEILQKARDLKIRYGREGKKRFNEKFTYEHFRDRFVAEVRAVAEAKR